VSGYHIEMRLRFTADDLEDAQGLVEALEDGHSAALDLVTWTCDSALVNGNAAPWTE